MAFTPFLSCLLPPGGAATKYPSENVETRLDESCPLRGPVARRRFRSRISAFPRALTSSSPPPPARSWIVSAGSRQGALSAASQRPWLPGDDLPAGCAARLGRLQVPRPKSYAESQSGRCARRSSAEPAGSYGSPAAMGSSQSVEIPGGGTEGYHVLRVRAAGAEAWGDAGAARPESGERPGRGCQRRGRGPATLAPGPLHGLATL